MLEADDPRLWVSCRECAGTTWISLRCEQGDQLAIRDAELPRRRCYRAQDHAAHSYVAPCGCRPQTQEAAQ